MFRGLAYKEWIKVRWFLLLFSGITLWTVLNLLLSLRESFEFMQPVRVWEAAIHRKSLFYSGLRYNALVAGVGIALVQFLPETWKRRLRILFHLPVNHNVSLYFMVGFGGACTFLVVLLNAVGLAVVISAYFPAECLRSAFVTAAPWFLAGFSGYLGTVLVVVEPCWWRRLLYGAAAFAWTSLLFQGRGYEVFAEAFGWYALVTILFLFTVILPAYRFKRGLT